MEFIESVVYTSRLVKAMKDTDYKDLQNFLIKMPKKGDFIKGSKYLRKI